MILRGDVVLFSRGISTMASNLRLSSLIPAGLIIESTAEEEGVIVVSARAGARLSCVRQVLQNGCR